MTRKIQILGTKRSNTNEIAHRIEVAAKRLGLNHDIDYDIERVTDIRRIMCFGPHLTPALYIDGEIRTAGSIPSIPEITEILNTPTHPRAISTSDKAHIDSLTVIDAKTGA